MKIGVLILGYRRPHLLRRSLEALAEHKTNEELFVFFSLDGPSHPNEQEVVNASKKVFEEASLRLRPTEKMYSTHNRGLRQNVMVSVSSALEKVDALIVIEDDCLVGPSSLDFFRWGLTLMKTQIEVGVISGTYLGKREFNSAFYANRFSSWGWATNRDTWEEFLSHSFSKQPLAELKPEIKRLTKHAPLPYRYEYWQITKNLENLDSWAIPFDLFLRSQGLRSIKPAVNQIMNIGFGDQATHTSRGSTLSIRPGVLICDSLAMVDESTSTKLESGEARDKFGSLLREILFNRRRPR